MPKVLVEELNLQNIANSIRSKNGSSNTYTPAEMSTAIAELPSGGEDLSNYFETTMTSGTTSSSGVNKIIKKIPNTIEITGNSALCLFYRCNNLIEIPLFNTNNVTNMRNMCYECSSITNLPEYNTSNVTDFYSMCYGCTNLVNVPVLNASKATLMTYMFSSCPNLSNDSLNNILMMCTTATSYTGNKKLSTIGLTSAQAQICTTLSNYQAFLDAGWITGY